MFYLEQKYKIKIGVIGSKSGLFQQNRRFGSETFAKKKYGNLISWRQIINTNLTVCKPNQIIALTSNWRWEGGYWYMGLMHGNMYHTTLNDPLKKVK